MKNNKDWSILVYVIILVIITMFLWMIIFNNSIVLENYKKIENIDTILAESIYYKWKLAIKYDKTINSNWTGFIDNLSCPNSVYMSWNTLINNSINTQLFSPTSNSQTWAYCLGTYYLNNFFIDFNSNFSNFSWATYSWETVTINTALNPYEAQFSDSDNTLMQFTNSPWNDNIDDNFNSDNYNVNSTWSAATWTTYPVDSIWNAFWDDDADARKINYYYIYPEAWLVNVFWNNSKTNKIIEENINNDDNINMKIWDSSNWILYFDIDEKVDLKIVEFSKTKFDTTWELIALETYNYSSTGWEIGYLQNIGWTLSFSDISTVQDFIFDFKNNDYAIFMKNNSTGTIFYRIRWYDKTTWKWLYIVPIDDSDSAIIKILWAWIIKSGADYIYKILEIVGQK